MLIFNKNFKLSFFAEVDNFCKYLVSFFSKSYFSGRLILVALVFFGFNTKLYSHHHKEDGNIDNLLNQIHILQRNFDITKAKPLALQAYVQSNKRGYSKGITKSSIYLAKLYLVEGKSSESLKYLLNIQHQEWFQNDLASKTEVARIRGEIYNNLYIFDKGIDEIQESLKFAAKIKDSNCKNFEFIRSYESLISSYSKQAKWDSVHYYIGKTQKILAKENEKNVYPNLINFNREYGQYYSQIGKLDSAEYYFQKALELSVIYKFPYKANIYNTLGKNELQKENYQQASVFFENASQNINELGVFVDNDDVFNGLYQSYKAMGDSTKANEFRLKALENNNIVLTDRVASSALVVKLISEEEKSSRNKLLRDILLVSVGIVVLISLFTSLYLRKKRSIKEDSVSIAENAPQKPFAKPNISFENIVQLAKNNNPDLLTVFNKKYPDFEIKLYNINNNLTNSDVLLCIFIWLGFSSKDIAQYTFVQHRSVQTKKNRLRKKLEIESEVDLYHFFHELFSVQENSVDKDF